MVITLGWSGGAAQGRGGRRGGIAGLVAARDLAVAGRDVLLLEGSPEVGGKLRSAEVAGLTVDVGAEAMLARRPEGVALVAELGAEVVHPTAATSAVWSRGALRPMPRSLMGVPFDLAQLGASGVLSAEGVARASVEVVDTDVPDDVSVGDLVAARLGDEIVDRLVEPLLGGVYAGHARQISAAAAVPQLLAMARRGSVLEQAAAVPTSAAPVFASLPGGMGRLPALVADGSFEVRMSAAVRELHRTGSGWRVVLGPTTHPETVEADAVVLATPAAPTARLLADVAPEAAAGLAAIEAASVAVVTLAFRASDVPDASFERSGFLVPPVERRAIKASTFSFAKWGWVRDLDPDVVVLRTSLGRHGEESTLQAGDDGLVRVSLADLATTAGITAQPVDTHVQRWGGALPQYAVGHLGRVARIRAGIADLPGLELCGAAYDGVGIPAVIGSARRAMASLLPAE
ncbi:oxygen-dependent protoporphyrinogen oxidase [Nocardioides exalbidus]|uniref:Oxygen-dependent protoporphyrinogen oxidase n=1 Tax=Nocardioides exalbidus TaxID=402596 RepID=A0A1H4KHY3_9ACTN|nr:FAD-dependent oxidoreductase [Nocardioides exalbidus]SEB57725.1 oxygen-dependent protoporphyrinogen oxidase [Nocardioides exalbidus]